MSRRRFSVDNIIHMPREAEVELLRGQSAAQVSKKLCICEQTYYR